jgi:hypothetical protein
MGFVMPSTGYAATKMLLKSAALAGDLTVVLEVGVVGESGVVVVDRLAVYHLGSRVQCQAGVVP